MVSETKKNPRCDKLLVKARALFDRNKGFEATQVYADVLNLEPDNAEALYRSAQFLISCGEYENARKLSNRLLRLGEENHEVFCQAGYIAFCLGDSGQAASYYQQSLAIKKTDDVCNKIGKLLLDLGHSEQGEKYFQEAFNINPEQPIYGENLITTRLKLGKFKEAFELALDMLRKFPNRKRVKNYVVSVARAVTVVQYDPAIEEALLLCLRQDGIEHQSLVSAWAQTVFFSPAFSGLSVKTDIEETLEWDDSVAALTEYELFRLGVQLMLPADPRMESLLVGLRRVFLEESLKENSFEGKDVLAFATALSEHCFLNEYVFSISDSETEKLERLKEKILKFQTQTPGAFSKEFFTCLAVFGCYEPLNRISEMSKVFEDAAWLGKIPPSMKSLVEFQVLEPLKERSIVQSIPSFGVSEDDISRRVRAQYEENPYPRWRDVFSETITLNKPEYQKPFDILIAGCGTGRQILIEKSFYPNSKTLAIDISLASIAYASRKCEALGIKNVRFMQADILLLEGLDERFDIAFASGVIHHMSDPEKALRILVSRLKAGGILNLGLYSALARQHVRKIREEIQKDNISPGPRSIRAYRQKIQAAIKNGDKRFLSIERSNDFYALSSCRDLLFHAHEHCYSLGEIKEILDRNDLAFLGFSLLEPGVIQKFTRKNPGPLDMLDLMKWDDFEQENPDTFVSMYQFFVCRKSEEKKARKDTPFSLGY